MRYFQATDGVFTVFRGTSRPEGFRFAMLTAYEDDVRSITFNNTPKTGCVIAVEITKQEYAALTAAKQARLIAAGKEPKWHTQPYHCWVLNTEAV